jgi:Flp pilus assembly protein TadD
MKKRDDKPAITPDKRTRILVYYLLAVATLTLYWQVWDFGFITMDDEPYVTGNPWVQLGLDMRTVAWAFTRWDLNTANWHPLTWLSHAADVSIHGSDAGGHHFTSVMFHTTNSLLLLLALTLMTGNFWRSAIVAALFAVHPQHVESVAWVSERKDVLSTFFLILTLLSYTSYARKPSAKRIALVTTALALGLMSKPMLVSVPLLLLLLDYWPLRRAAQDKPWEKAWRPLVVEKWPLFALAAGSCVVTFLAQRSAGAIVTSHPVGVRLANAVTSCVHYVVKTFWPTDLAMYYPHPGTSTPTWLVYVSILGLVITTASAIRLARKTPYFTVGWLWFLISLVPVIGIVQVGSQGMADRYTYVPHIGLFVLVVWGIAALVGLDRPAPKNNLVGATRATAAVIAIVAIATFSTLTYKQIGFWRDAETAWRHTIAVTADNAVAHCSLGEELLTTNDVHGAITQFRRAVAIEPEYTQARANLSSALIQEGDLNAAAKEAQTALRICPNHVGALINLAAVKMMRNDLGSAESLLEKAVKIDPANAEAQNNLGALLAQQGRLDEAIEHFREALRRNPGDASSAQNLQQALEMKNSGM